MEDFTDYLPPMNDEAKVVPPKRGRPKGRRTRPKGELGAMLDRVQNLFKIVEHLLTPKQVEYYRRAFSGAEDFDPLKHAEFFMLMYSVYANDILSEAIGKKIVSQDIAQTLREFRMGLKEVEDMRRAREKDMAKTDDESRLVDPTRKSKVGVLEAILAESPQK